MPFNVNTNIQSLFSQRALRVNTDALEKNIEHLSTGSRINRASDDPSGHSISSKLTTELLGLDKAKQNSSDGISMIQTAEGSMEIIQDNLLRIRELVVQGLNGTNSPDERGALQREINERVLLISDLGQQTEFNGQNLLYNATDKVIQTGADVTDTTTLSLESGIAANIGNNIDVDYVVTNTSNADFGHLVEGATTGFALNRLQIPNSNVDSQGFASHSTNFPANLDDIDALIANISRMRSYLGAMQNTLESKLDYISVASENSEASKSRITDVDVAKESSKLIQNQVLQQTASSMLVQANSLPQTILNLLPR